MNENDVREFQANFSPPPKQVRIDSLPENPFLKSEISYAAQNGKLSSRITVILSSDDSACQYADYLVEQTSKNFADIYIFKIDVKNFMAEDKIGLIEKYKKFLLYGNILLVSNFHLIRNNPAVYSAVRGIILSLHSTSNLLIASSMPIGDVVTDEILGNMLSGSKLFALEKREQNPDEGFSSFQDFISSVKKEAGVQESFKHGENREDYIEKLYVWEMKNFNVDRLKSIINEDNIEKVKSEFEKYTANVRELVELHKEYGLLNTRNFPEDAAEIEAMLFDPDRNSELRKKIEELKEKIKYLRTFQSGMRAEMTIETFVGDATNRFAYNKINEVLNGENIDNVVIITGTNGTGKTHLLNSVVNRIEQKRIVMLDKSNIEQALNNAYVMKYADSASMFLIDDLDLLYENPESRVVLKSLVMSTTPKVITMYRKFSIDDKELLTYLNKYNSYNIQPSSLYIKKIVYKSQLARFGLTVNDFIMNYLLDYIDVPLSRTEEYFSKLSALTGGVQPTIEQIQSVFPQAESKKAPAAKRSEYDTSRLLKEWLNEHDRLYVEFEG